MVIVDVSVDRNGKVVSTIKGGRPLVRRGDSVVWQSAQGDLIITFEGNMPFGGVQRFVSAQGQPTQPVAVVQQKAPLGPVTCTITLGGKIETGTAGVDIQP